MQEACTRETLAGRLPDTMAAEGVHLRYAVDTRLDELLALVFKAVTTPPLLDNPFPRIVEVIRNQGVTIEQWKLSHKTLEAKITNAVARVGPCDSFIYAGMPRSPL